MKWLATRKDRGLLRLRLFLAILTLRWRKRITDTSQGYQLCPKTRLWMFPAFFPKDRQRAQETRSDANKKMKTNTPTQSITTHEGARAKRIGPLQQLRRSVMACMLWESEFYESGEDIAKRISDTIAKCKPEEVAMVAIEAREKAKLRHVPLWIVRCMASLESHRKLVAATLAAVIQRPDEICEFLSLYWKDGKVPVAASVKKGLAAAFRKFNEYQFAKWDKPGAIRLRDALFIAHAKPESETQAALFKKIAQNELSTPDTWEVALSGGADKAATFIRLMEENKLGALALLRNLRNMIEAKVPAQKIKAGLATMSVERVLPFRFISAAKYAPQFEPDLEKAMFRCSESREPMRDKTALLIDHSRSMESTVSSRSEISRCDAACALAMILRETNPDTRVFTFSSDCLEIPPRRGFALRDAIKQVMRPEYTLLGKAVRYVYDRFPECTRIIVITDEQSADPAPDPHGRGYVINVASAQNGIGYGAWTHIDGWSEAILDYIQQFEAVEA